MPDDEKRLVAEIPAYLKERVDADPRDNKRVVIDSLKTEFQTNDDAAVRRRINEKEREISELKTQIHDRSSELDRAENELESLENQLQTSAELEQEKHDAIDERLEKLQNVKGVIDETHPTVKAIAQDYFSGDREAALEAMRERNEDLELVPEEYL